MHSTELDMCLPHVSKEMRKREGERGRQQQREEEREKENEREGDEESEGERERASIEWSNQTSLSRDVIEGICGAHHVSKFDGESTGRTFPMESRGWLGCRRMQNSRTLSTHSTTIVVRILFVDKKTNA